RLWRRGQHRGGSDLAGKVTLGTGVVGNACTLTFTVTLLNEPACTAVNETNSGGHPGPVGTKSTLSVGSNSRARYQTRRGGPAGGLPFVFSGRRATVTDSPSLTRRSGRPRPRLHAGMRNPLASAATERPARWPARDIRIARPGAPPRPAAPRARRALAGTPEAGRRRLHPVQMQIAEIKPLFRVDAEVYRTPELGRPPRHPSPYSSALPDPDVPLRSLIYGRVSELPRSGTILARLQSLACEYASLRPGPKPARHI